MNIRSLEDDLTLANREISTLRAQLAQATARADKLDVELGEWKAHNERRTAFVDRLSQRLASAKDELAAVEAREATLRTAAKQLRDGWRADATEAEAQGIGSTDSLRVARLCADELDALLTGEGTSA